MIERVALEDSRRVLRERVRVLPALGEARIGVRRLRGLLEEVGVRCDDTAELHDVDAVLFASGRGTEALVAARLDDDDRLVAYARIIARLLTGDLHAPVDFKIEYADSEDAPSRRERDEERLVLALAQAIATGSIETAPRPLFEDVPPFTLAFTPRSAARSTLGGFHWWSNLWYRRSGTYRAWRSRAPRRQRGDRPRRRPAWPSVPAGCVVPSTWRPERAMDLQRRLPLPVGLNLSRRSDT